LVGAEGRKGRAQAADPHLPGVACEGRSPHGWKRRAQAAHPHLRTVRNIPTVRNDSKHFMRRPAIHLSHRKLLYLVWARLLRPHPYSANPWVSSRTRPFPLTSVVIFGAARFLVEHRRLLGGAFPQ